MFTERNNLPVDIVNPPFLIFFSCTGVFLALTSSQDFPEQHLSILLPAISLKISFFFFFFNAGYVCMSCEMCLLQFHMCTEYFLFFLHFDILTKIILIKQSDLLCSRVIFIIDECHMNS